MDSDQIIAGLETERDRLGREVEALTIERDAFAKGMLAGLDFLIRSCNRFHDKSVEQVNFESQRVFRSAYDRAMNARNGEVFQDDITALRTLLGLPTLRAEASQ